MYLCVIKYVGHVSEPHKVIYPITTCVVRRFGHYNVPYLRFHRGFDHFSHDKSSKILAIIPVS